MLRHVFAFFGTLGVRLVKPLVEVVEQNEALHSLHYLTRSYSEEVVFRGEAGGGGA